VTGSLPCVEKPIESDLPERNHDTQLGECVNLADEECSASSHLFATRFVVGRGAVRNG
jgi:hypothetical protein